MSWPEDRKERALTRLLFRSRDIEVLVVMRISYVVVLGLCDLETGADASAMKEFRRLPVAVRHPTSRLLSTFVLLLSTPSHTITIPPSKLPQLSWMCAEPVISDLQHSSNIYAVAEFLGLQQPHDNVSAATS